MSALRDKHLKAEKTALEAELAAVESAGKRAKKEKKK
jgi:hypothetical protein